MSDVSTTIQLNLRVIPGASKPGVVGWLGEVLKVRVAAPPERGRANRAVEALLAQALDLPARAVRVVGGVTSRQKVLEIDGMSLPEIHARLGDDGV